MLTRQVIVASLIFCLSLCVIAGFLQIMVFPNILIENQEKFHLQITYASDEYKATLLFNQEDPVPAATESPLLPGVIALEMTIKISGTENTGLNIRADAGTDKPVVYLAQEGEVYKIMDGPVISNSLIWWKIVQLPDSQKSGWAVQDYLEPVN